MCTRVPGSFEEADANNISIGLRLENYPELHWRVVRKGGIPWRCARLPQGEACGAVRNRSCRAGADLGRVRGLILATYRGNNIVVDGPVVQPCIYVSSCIETTGYYGVWTAIHGRSLD